MQELLPVHVTTLLGIEVVLTFVLIIITGFVRYATGPRMRFWAVGWLVLASMTGPSVFNLGMEPDVFDAVAACGLMFGSTLLLNGSLGAGRAPFSVATYLTMGVGAAAYSAVTVVLGVPTPLMLAPPLLYAGVAGIYFYRSLPTVDRHPGWLNAIARTAALLWAASCFVAPTVGLVFREAMTALVILQGTVVSVQGACLFALFVKVTDQRFQTQFQVALLLSGIVQHDIRGYLHLVSQSLELARDWGPDSHEWLEVAAATLANASKFVEYMREVSSQVAHLQSTFETIDIRQMVVSVLRPLMGVYRDRDARIENTLTGEIPVSSNQLLRQVVWNILDNALKHGATRIGIAHRTDGRSVTLIIEDDAGGLSSAALEYLNSEQGAVPQMPPTGGLGLFLIKALSSMCNCDVHAEVIEKGEKAVGTRFHVRLSCALETRRDDDAHQPDSHDTRAV